MTDIDQRVAAVLDRLEPATEHKPDWEEVLRRVSVAREREAGGAALTRRLPLHALGRKAAFAIVLAALIVALVAVLPGTIGRHRMTLVDRAIAAIGNGPTTHVVLDQGVGTRLVDFRTGRTTLVQMRIEYWSDPKLGTLRISTLDGKPLQTILIPPSQNAVLSDWWRPLVTGYGAQLRNGAYRLVGAGTIEGQAIDWIASKPQTFTDANSGAPHEYVREIAISRTTYKPVYWRMRVDGVVQPDSGVRVIVAETLPRRPALFAHRRPFTGGYAVTPTAPRTTLARARAEMNPDPVVPPKRLAGLLRTWVGLPRYLAPGNSYRDQIGGVELYYGHTDDLGVPTYTGSFISITEFPHLNPAVTAQGVRVFPQDAAIVNNASATMKTHGLYVVIKAGNGDEALAAARALAR